MPKCLILTHCSYNIKCSFALYRLQMTRNKLVCHVLGTLAPGEFFGTGCIGIVGLKLMRE